MQVIHQIQLKFPTEGSRVRKVPMIVVGGNRVWIANGPNIHIISATVCYFFAHCITFSIQVKTDISVPLSNIHPITCMLALQKTMMVWVSDTTGQISIWDAQVQH